MKVEIKKITEEEKNEMVINSWPIWEKEVSRFSWTYDSDELCYIIEGDFYVETKEETLHILAGDFVKFPSGLSCVWDIKKPVRKHYKFIQ